MSESCRNYYEILAFGAVWVPNIYCFFDTQWSDNSSWSSLHSLLLTSENSCFTMEAFHWKFYFVRKHFFEACNSEFNISVMEVYSKTPITVM